MKKIFIYIELTILCAFSFACEDWFDVQPQTQVKEEDLFDSENGFKRALIGVYTLMADNDTYGSEATVAFIEVLGGTYSIGDYGSLSSYYREASCYNYETSGNEAIINKLWSENYTAIANLNNILENIEEKRELFNEGIYEIIKGETLGLRAYLHFDLLRNFAPAPLNGLDVPAIPYVDAIGMTPFPQLTINELIERVIEDLKQAETYLKDYDPIGPAFDTYEESVTGYAKAEEVAEASNFLMFRKERMNYYGVLGTLARVHLYRGTSTDKALAAEYALAVINNSGKFELNESTVIDGAPNASYAMCYLAQEYLFSFYKRDLTEAVNDVYLDFSGTPSKGLEIEEEKRNEYFEVEKYGGVADVRYSKLFQLKQDGLNRFLVKYDYQDIHNVKRIPLIKLSEMYLIVAEANNDMEYLQQLRLKRGLKNMAVGTTLEEEIAAEYRKEFIGEGQMFYYFKRKNKPVNANMNGLNKFILPLPDTEEERGNID